METVLVRTEGQTPTEGKPGRLSHAPKQHKGKNKKKLAALVGGIVLVLLVIFGGWMLHQSSARANIDSGKYQAVFFTNGQVYFGKLQQLGGGYFKLTNVFYIQAKQTAETKDSKNPQEASAQPTSDVQLIKLGNEVHGPEDAMIISHEQILFFENLKSDGKVAESITKYQSQK